VPAAEALANTALSSPPGALAFHNTPRATSPWVAARCWSTRGMHAVGSLSSSPARTKSLLPFSLGHSLGWRPSRTTGHGKRSYGRLAASLSPTVRASNRMGSPGCGNRLMTGTAGHRCRAGPTLSNGFRKVADGGPSTRRRYSPHCVFSTLAPEAWLPGHALEQR
jgi:hypothetical protein